MKAMYFTDMSVKKTFEIEDLPKVVRNMRKLAGLNQQELAELSGLGKALIFELEKGHRRVSLENLLKVCKVLNIKLEIRIPLEMDIEE